MVDDIQVVWRRIQRHQGERFHQIRGQPFTYQVRGSVLYPDRVNQGLGKSQFAQALELVPLENTVSVQHLRGPSYLYAILMDPRIRAGEW